MSKDARLAFWPGRSVAITGATGFVGHHVAMELVRRGARVVALVRASSDRSRLAAAGVRCIEADLQDPAAIARAARGCNLVFHIAGAVDFEGDWLRFRRINVQGTRHVLAAARSAGAQRVVHTSSIVAVGAACDPVTLDETASWNLGALNVPYVTTKREAEQLALASARPDMEVVVVNPASVVGPDDFSHSEFGTLCRRFWRGRIPLHFGGGNNFVDVRDVAAGHLLAAQHGRSGQRYVLGGSNRSYTALFADLARVAGRPIFRLRMPNALAGVVASINQRLDHGRPTRSYLTLGQARLMQLFFYFNCGKAQRELGYQPRSFDQTVADTYAFWMGRKAG
jgi:dihydroflavonol-4-reductase